MMKMHKVERIEHPLIELWAQKHFDLECEMRSKIGEMSIEQVQDLRRATESLTTTNCWFAAYDVRPMIEEILTDRERRDRDAAEKARTDAAPSGNKEK